MTFDCPNTSLRKGQTNDQVKKLQTMLHELGYYTGRIDSYFGSVTEKAVKNFQKDTKHSQDGWFGPKTCKSLNEKYESKIKSTSKKSNKTVKNTNTTSINPPFKFDTSTPLTAILVVKDEVVSLPDAPKTNSNKLHKLIISDVISAPMNSDITGLTQEVTVQIPYTKIYANQIRELQKVELSFYNGNQKLDQLTLDGYISNIKGIHENDMFKIELSIVNYVEFLNKQVENYNETCKISEHVKKIASLCGLNSDLDLTGLTDSTVTISTEKESSDSEVGSSTTGAGGTMSIDEIYSKAATFKYGGIGTGLSPEKAWAAYEKGGRTFDCFDCSNFLFYCLKNFAKIPCRIVTGYSPYSSSHTHRVVQIKTNGSWACPKQAWSLTRNLRPFTPENKYALKALLTWEG